MNVNAALPRGQSLPPLLSEREVIGYLGLSRAGLANLIARRIFPAPVRIGSQRKAWPETDILAWLESRRGIPSSRSR